MIVPPVACSYGNTRGGAAAFCRFDGQLLLSTWRAEHPAALLIRFRPTTAVKDRVEFAAAVNWMPTSLGEIRRSN